MEDSAPFCILIPTVNRKDLLMEALDYYVRNYKTVDIIILDNGNQDIPQLAPNVFIYKTPENLGVARSWNMLIHKAILKGHEWFLVMNDDIIYKKPLNEICALIRKQTTNTFLQPRPFYNWSIFLLHKSVFRKVGVFDPAFARCFFEDNDYRYRMKLAGVNVRYEDELAPEVYRNSQTIEKNPLLGGYIENREYYLRKWGGLPDQEQYIIPFTKQPTHG